MKQAEAIAGLAVGRAPVVKGEEFEIGHADRLLDPQGRRNLHCVAERHCARFSRGFTAVAGHMPLGVAEPRHTQHRVGVGRDQSGQRPNIACQFEQGGESSWHERRWPEFRKQGAADPYATLGDRRLGQNRLNVMLRLARVSIGVTKHDARMEEMLIATRRNQDRCPRPMRLSDAANLGCRSPHSRELFLRW